jgi:hypothetical protein
MKILTMTTIAASVAFTLLVACSSSSSGGSPSSSFPSCSNPVGSTGPGTPACSSCLQGSCGSQSSSVETSCSGYLTCYEGCQCSDVACLEGCLSMIDSTCQGPYAQLTSCLTQNCASQCNAGAGDAG